MRQHFIPVIVSGLILMSGIKISACTGITIKAQDGAVVRGRTLEFAVDLNSDVVVIPRKLHYRGTTPNGDTGLKWQNKYAAAGANFAGVPYLVDGINEAGLSGGIFYFPGFAGFQAFDKKQESLTMAPWQLLTWILTSFKDLDEVKHAVQKIVVCKTIFKPWNSLLPLHYIITDSKGRSIVIEYVKGKLHLHDNPAGVLTNSPDFAWHITNLRNYLNLSPQNSPDKKLNSIKLSSLGEGSGMLGLPGDFTPPSRFVRAFFFASSSLPQKNGEKAVYHLFHILHSFDIPIGTVRSSENKVTSYDRTQWTTACDLKNKCFYYRTENNSRIKVLNLMKCKLDSNKIIKLKMASFEKAENITGELK